MAGAFIRASYLECCEAQSFIEKAIPTTMQVWFRVSGPLQQMWSVRSMSLEGRGSMACNRPAGQLARHPAARFVDVSKAEMRASPIKRYLHGGP